MTYSFPLCLLTLTSVLFGWWGHLSGLSNPAKLRWYSWWGLLSLWLLLRLTPLALWPAWRLTALVILLGVLMMAGHIFYVLRVRPHPSDSRPTRPHAIPTRLHL